MKKFMTIFFGLFFFCSIAFAGSVNDYGQLTGTPDDGTITYIAYRTSAGDAEILTEDGYNSALGLDQGYQNKFWILAVENFSSSSSGENITLLFTGIHGQAGKSGQTNFDWDVDPNFTDHGTITFGESTSPSIPSNLSASVISPGNVQLNWTSVAGLTYRVYRSSQASGAGNGHSNGRYQRIASGVTPPYEDNSSPQTGVWYIVVAEDGSGRLSGHTDEVYADASLSVELESFTARGHENSVFLSWTTASEVNNLGFNILRAKAKTGPFKKINTSLIQGRKNATESKTYEFEDRHIVKGLAYYYQLEQVDLDGSHRYFEPVSVQWSENEKFIPKQFKLEQNYPNPFNPETTIQYDLPRSEYVKIAIFNLLGEKVRSLVDEKQLAGRYSVIWDGQLNSRKQATTGVYICKLQAGDFIAIKKLVLVR